MKVKVTLLLCFSALLLFTQCAKDLDTYYDRPAWLEDPIYQELEANGNFTLFLQAIDRTLHASVLQGAGLYTCFAPNDTAFQAWLDENHYTSVDKIPQQEVEDLVAYNLVYNQFQEENLGSALVDQVWTPGIAYKYKTTYYPMLSREEYNGDSVWVFDSNAYGGYTYNSKNDIVGNYKYLPVFTTNFFNSSSPQLTAGDYLAFYPASTWAASDGLGNVGAASIIGGEHLAENGVFYELNKVVEPLPNILSVLKNDPECSDMWDLINYKTPGGSTYYFKYFIDFDGLTEQMKLLYPSLNIDNVYIRGYSGFGFDPQLEAYTGEGTSADVTQENGFTLFVPSNEAYQDFMKNKIEKYYSSFEQVPAEISVAFIASQTCESLVWPSFFNQKKNLLDEYLSGQTDGVDIDAFGVTSKLMASNGIVYKSNKIIKSRYFESVFSEIFLNPAYNFTYKTHNLYFSGESGLADMLMRCPLNGYMSERNTLFVVDDQLLENDGFYYNDVDQVFNHTYLTVSGAATRIKRLCNNLAFLGYVDTLEVSVASGFNWGASGDNRTTKTNKGAYLTDSIFAATGVANYNSWQFRVTNEGEMVRFKNNTIQAVGNIEDGSVVNMTKVQGDYNNGQVFELDGLLDYAPRRSETGDAAYEDKTLWEYLDQARTENPDVKMFVDLVDSVMKTETGELLGVKVSNFYTVLMPNNKAMLKAQTAGLFPASILTTANYVDNDPEGVDNALRFLQGHFLVGSVFPDDNLPFIFPYSTMSDDPTCQVTPTLLAITNEDLDLTNEKTQVVAYKYMATSSTYSLRFYAKDIVRGTTKLVEGKPAKADGTNNHLQVSRTKITGAADYSVTRSNRMACRAVLHEVNNYLNFIDQAVE